MRLIAGLIVSLLAAAPWSTAFALPGEELKWTEVRTPHLRFTSSASEERTLIIAEMLENFSAALGRMLPATTTGGSRRVPVRLGAE